jgi:hypothetical protein
MMLHDELFMMRPSLSNGKKGILMLIKTVNKIVHLSACFGWDFFRGEKFSHKSTMIAP